MHWRCVNAKPGVFALRTCFAFSFAPICGRMSPIALVHFGNNREHSILCLFRRFCLLLDLMHRVPVTADRQSVCQWNRASAQPISAREGGPSLGVLSLGSESAGVRPGDMIKCWGYRYWRAVKHSMCACVTVPLHRHG